MNDEYEFLELPKSSSDITDITNLAITLEKDIPLQDRTKINELFEMVVDIVHMNVSIELIETTGKYNDIITGINRASMKSVK